MLGIRHYRYAAVDLWQGDLTEFCCDAMVNAANTALAGGGGVDGAIHRVGGPSILQECQAIGRCPTGQAVVTGAGDLPARWVIHAVGPVWSEAGEMAVDLLTSAYQQSLQKADHLGARHMAFPAISAGAYGAPLEAAATIAIKALRDYLDGVRLPSTLQRVTFVLYSTEAYQVFQKQLFEHFPETDA